MTHSNKSISPLRQRMIEDMTLRKLKPKTQATYLRAVTKFTRFFARSPDLASPEDLRAFQLQLVEAGVSSTTIWVLKPHFLTLEPFNSEGISHLGFLVLGFHTGSEAAIRVCWGQTN